MKIIVKSNRRDFQKNGKEHTVHANEVILSGGAFNTPQLLQLSGIGDSEFLKSKGIEPRMHLPGVGENFEDHLEVYIQHKCKQPVSLQPSLDVKRMPFIGLQWILHVKVQRRLTTLKVAAS